VVEDLPSKLEALRSNSSLKKKQKDFLQFLEKVSLRYFLKSKISTIFKNTFSNSIIMLYYFQENLFKILLFSSVANFTERVWWTFSFTGYNNTYVCDSQCILSHIFRGSSVSDVNPL
jgi:hypothetical protein